MGVPAAVPWILLALQGLNMWDQYQQGQKQSKFQEEQMRNQSAALKKFAGQMYSMQNQQAQGVMQTGERSARAIENQGQWKLRYMEDAGKRQIGEYTARVGSSGVVIGQGSARRAILYQARANGLAQRLQAAETKRMAAETRYGANTQAYFMSKSAKINRDNYLVSAGNWSQKADFTAASRPYQGRSTVLGGFSDILKTQTMFEDQAVWS
jgi:hypothetical protein